MVWRHISSPGTKVKVVRKGQGHLQWSRSNIRVMFLKKWVFRGHKCFTNTSYSIMFLYAICILKSFASHISVIVCSFFEFGKVSKWCVREWVNSLPHNKILDWSKFKSFPDDKIILTRKFKFGLGRVENIFRKGEMLVTCIFCILNYVFKSFLFQRCYNSVLCSTGLNSPLSWHWPASRSAIPIIQSAKKESHYYQFLKTLVCRGRGSNPWLICCVTAKLQCWSH